MTDTPTGNYSIDTMGRTYPVTDTLTGNYRFDTIVGTFPVIDTLTCKITIVLIQQVGLTQ